MSPDRNGPDRIDQTEKSRTLRHLNQRNTSNNFFGTPHFTLLNLLPQRNFIFLQAAADPVVHAFFEKNYQLKRRLWGSGQAQWSQVCCDMIAFSSVL